MPHNASEIYKIKGNKPLLLNKPQKVWIVKSGILALFTTKVKAEESIGNRFYLFSASKGDALFGAELWSESLINQQSQDLHTAESTTPHLQKPTKTINSLRSILAVTIETTEIQSIEFTDIAQQISLSNSETISLLEGWIHNLSQLITAKPIETETLAISETSTLSLSEGQILQAKENSLIWIKITEGNASWIGLDALHLDDTCCWFPLTNKTWLKAVGKVKVHITTTIDLEKIEQLADSLALFHQYIHHYLNIQLQQDNEAKLQQFQQRQQLNEQVIETAIDNLAIAFKPKQSSLIEEETPLLIAIGAVGRAMGINICIPNNLRNNRHQFRELIEEVALASRIRTRRVILAGNWWRQEHSPLLAFTQEDNRPVALLNKKSKGSRYVLFEPELHTHTPVDEYLATTLTPEAYMFYRPLPSVINKAIEVFQFSLKDYRKDLLFLLGVGMIGTVLGMAIPQSTAILINNAIPDSDRFLLLQISLGLLAVTLGKTILNLSQGLITLRVTNSTESTLQPAVWDRLLRLSPSFIRQFSTGDLLMRLMSISQIYRTISGATQRTLLNGLFSLLNLGLMLIYSLPLALVGVSFALLGFIFTLVSSFFLLSLEHKEKEWEGKIQSLTVQLINGVSKLRVAAAESRAFAAWAKKYTQLNQINFKIIGINNLVAIFNELLSLVSFMFLYWFGFTVIENAQGDENGLKLGTFLAFNAAFGTFFSGVTSLTNTWIELLEISPLWQRAKPILTGEIESDTNKTEPGLLQGQIELKNVTFRYRPDGLLILNQVNIQAKPGEFIALVGPSGSGKSTILRLLLGFETPLSGIVSYDSQDLTELNLPGVRRQLGVVLQNGKVMQGSIFDNITGGALVSMDQAWEAARLAGLAEEIEQMPMGIHTLISEGGSNLSGGQLQRLLIARSLIFKPKIILFDEATSSLDNQTQRIITKSLEQLNATRIVIAHRLSTIRNADRIYVMQGGKVIQVGSFEELMKQSGFFTRLVQRQLD